MYGVHGVNGVNGMNGAYGVVYGVVYGVLWCVVKVSKQAKCTKIAAACGTELQVTRTQRSAAGGVVASLHTTPPPSQTKQYKAKMQPLNPFQRALVHTNLLGSSNQAACSICHIDAADF